MTEDPRTKEELLNEIKYLNYMLDEVDKHTLDYAAEQAQIKMHNEGNCNNDFCIVCETQEEEE